MITTHNNGKGVKNMSQDKEKNKQSESKKTAYNNNGPITILSIIQMKEKDKMVQAETK